MEHINSSVDEGEEIDRNVKATKDEESDWLKTKLTTLEKDGGFFLVAEVDGKVIATSNLTRRRAYANHVGVICITVTKGYWKIGIGTEMLQTLSIEAKEMSLRVLLLAVFSKNEVSLLSLPEDGFRGNQTNPENLLQRWEVHR